VGQHGSASGSILLGLDGFEVTAAEVIDNEWWLGVQTTATTVGCVACGSQARVHARRTVRVRDLPIGGRPVVLAWHKRVWRCGEPACAAQTWTEQQAAIRPRAVLTCRARAEACRRVGKDAHAVAAVARDLGVGWATVMRAVADHGTPLVEDPARLDGVAALGLDETSFLKATRRAPTRYVTGLVDLEGGRLLDVVADRTRAALDGWLGARPYGWLAQVGTVALDPWRGYASALVASLGHARLVVDHFHAIKLANTAVDQVRRRTQQTTLGHRGRKHDPLYRIRKLLLTAAEQLTGRGRARLRAGLTVGDRFGEVAAAWQGKELLRAVYAAGGLAAALPWIASIAGAMVSRSSNCPAWPAPCASGRPRSWPGIRTTGCSNGPTEGINLLIKKVKRVGHGFRNSPTIGCGWCCTAASGGRLTAPQACEAAHHASWRRAAKGWTMAGQARVLRVTAGCESPLIIAARACPAHSALLAQPLTGSASASELQPIGGGEAPVCLAGAFVGCRGAVAAQHRAGLPAGKAHQVGFVATLGQPKMGECMAELVRVEPFQAGLAASPTEDLRNARLGDATELADPQPLQISTRMTGADSEVPVEGLGGPTAERQRALPAALTEHERDLEVEVEIGKAHAGNLGAARAHVDQQQDEGGVAASLEVAASAGLQEPAKGVLAHQRNGLIGHGGRSHLGHRASGDLAFGLQPAIEHPQAPVAVGGRGGLPAGKLVGDERLHVLASRQLELHPSGREEQSGQPERVKVRLDRAASLVLGSQVQLEGADQVGYAGVGHDRTVPRRRVESDALEPLCYAPARPS
jgi:transposase